MDNLLFPLHLMDIFQLELRPLACPWHPPWNGKYTIVPAVNESTIGIKEEINLILHPSWSFSTLQAKSKGAILYLWIFVLCNLYCKIVAQIRSDVRKMRGGIALECCQWDGKLFLSKTKTIRDIHLFMEIGVNWLRIIKFNKKTRHQLIYGNWRKLASHNRNK